MQLYNSNSQASVSFSSAFGKDLKLIEVTEDILKLVDAGESLNIIGGDGDAVLCSKDRTFSIKRVESSNSVFFIPPSSSANFTIDSFCTDYYEVKNIPGRLEQLESVLNETIYQGSEYEASNPPADSSKLVTRAGLSKTIQSSEAEVDAFLKSIGVVEIDGYLRRLSTLALHRTMKQLFLVILSEGWSIDRIDQAACASSLADCDPVLLSSVLSSLGSLKDGVWSLRLSDVLKGSAHLIFEERSRDDKKILVSAFMSDWFQQTPGVSSEAALDESLLRGLAIKDEDITEGKSTPYYRYLSASELQRDPKLRFAQIYGIKQRFKLDELEPYLQDLFGAVGQPKSMAELLLLHTNCIDGSFTEAVLMSSPSDCDSDLKSLLQSVGIKDQADITSYCSKTTFHVSTRTFRVLLNVATILNFQEKYESAFRIVKILFSRLQVSEQTIGTTVTAAFLLIETALNCHHRERVKADYLGVVGDAFRVLDKAFELVNFSKANVLAKTISADGSGLEYFETAAVVLFCHTAFYKSKVCFALQDQVTAKQIINNSLEIIWKYLQFVMTDAPSIWISHTADKTLPSLTNYLNIAETDAPGKAGSKMSLSAESIAVLSSKICHICKMGTSLNARAEFLSGNFVGAKAICAQLRVLESLPNTVEDRRIALDNNEACISLQLKENFSASAQIHRLVGDICTHFRAISCPKQLPRSTVGSEEKPLCAMPDAAILGCLYNAGLSLLKLTRPLEALSYFEKVAAASTLSSAAADQPYVWIRMAEACLQQDAITNCPVADPLLLQVVSVSKGRSRRLQIITSSPIAPEAPAAVDKSAERCTLTSAVVYLRKALEVIKSLQQAVGAGDANFKEKEQLRLVQLENQALLRLTYILLKNQDPNNALEYAQRLVDQLSNEEFSQTRCLGYSYYVEVLCQLGKHEKAGSFLKAQFDVPYTDAVLSSAYLCPTLFRSTHATPTKLTVGQHKQLPPGVAAMSMQVNKAIVLILRNQLSAAVSVLEAVVRLNPAFMPALRCLIYVYIRQGKVKHALNVVGISQKAKL